jgi:membrane protease YdiL (CAAX protease family)
VLVFALTGVVEILPAPEIVHGSLENVVGSAVPAFVVVAVVGGAAGVRELAGRVVRWRVELRWYAVALLGLPGALLVVAPLLYGGAPLRALAENWPLIITSFLPTLVVMAAINSIAEEAGFTGFLFARLQMRHRPVVAALIAFLPFWAWHAISFVYDERSLTAGLALAGLYGLALLASRIMTGWLYNVGGASVLIAGLFHATFNATVNPTGFGVAVLGLPQGELVYVVGGLVVIAAATVAVATRGRLGAPARTA